LLGKADRIPPTSKGRREKAIFRFLRHSIHAMLTLLSNAAINDSKTNVTRGHLARRYIVSLLIKIEAKPLKIAT